MSLRDWFEDALNVDVIPPAWMKYAILVASSICGGVAYATSGSWLVAIGCDLFSMSVLWIVTKAAEPMGRFVVKLVLLILP